MPSLCEDLKTKYEHLIKLTAEFTARYSNAKDSGDLGEVRRLRKDLEAARGDLIDHIFIITVPDAKNPYHKALLEAGLDPTKTQEQQEITIDIPKEIERQLAVYKEARDASGNPCLQEWVKDITENQDLLYTEVAKDRRKIMERIKVGMIPVVMPRKSVQIRTWEAALTNLKPICVEDRVRKTVNSASIDDDYEDETGKMTADGFFKNIPDRPYLVWVKPTETPNPFTVGKPFGRLQEHNAILAEDYSDIYDPTDIIPTEYSALQAVRSASIQREFNERTNGTDGPVDINPLDSKTVTRFLSAETFSTGLAPAAHFFVGRRQVIFTRTPITVMNEGGCRPASRT